MRVRRGFGPCRGSVRGWGQPAPSGACAGMVRLGSAALGFRRAPGCAVLVSQKVWGPLPPGQEIGGHPSACWWEKASSEAAALGEIQLCSNASRAFFLNAPLTPCRDHDRGLRWCWCDPQLPSLSNSWYDSNSSSADGAQAFTIAFLPGFEGKKTTATSKIEPFILCFEMDIKACLLTRVFGGEGDGKRSSHVCGH